MNGTSANSGGGLTVAELLAGQRAATERVGAARGEMLRRQLFSSDVIAGALTGVVTAAVAGVPDSRVGAVALLIAVLWPAIAYLCGLYAVDDLRSWASGIGQTSRLALCCLLLSWPAYGLLATVLDAAHPALGAVVGTVAVGCATATGRAAARTWLHRSVALRQRTLLVGSGTVAHQVVRRLEAHAELGLDPIGFLDEDDSGAETLGLPRLGSLDMLAPLVANERVDRVVVTFTRGSHEELLDCLRVCREASIPVDVVPRLFDFLDGAHSLAQIGGLPLLSITVPTFSRLAQASKRALDIAGSTISLVALLPILAIIAAAIKLDSRGPVLFRQPRAGRGGRTFTLYKFRSMYTGTGVLVGDDGAIVKLRDDARVTRVGRVLRRLSLDEAPQLLNVLKGDMSLVGPRPLVLAEAAALTEGWQDRRADLRPGLTGPWQVSGRSHISFAEMIRIDYQYVTGWSLARDVEILIATLPAVFSGRGAY